jgi:hypothetical protein
VTTAATAESLISTASRSMRLRSPVVLGFGDGALGLGERGGRPDGNAGPSLALSSARRQCRGNLSISHDPGSFQGFRVAVRAGWKFALPFGSLFMYYD